MKRLFTIGIALVIFAAFLVGCVRKPQEIHAESVTPECAEGQELFCLASSQENAQEIADMYGIELVSFSEGVATFHTEENPVDVINRGIEKGYPVLELNSIMTIDGN